jgi:hypothetical protein
MALHDFEECDACLRRALEIEPRNPIAAAELVKLAKARRDYADKSRLIAKTISKKLFQNNSKSSESNATSATATSVSTNVSATLNDDGDAVQSKTASPAPSIKEVTHASRNTVVFLATSLIVVVASIIAIVIMNFRGEST